MPLIQSVRSRVASPFILAAGLIAASLVAAVPTAASADALGEAAAARSEHQKDAHTLWRLDGASLREGEAGQPPAGWSGGLGLSRDAAGGLLLSGTDERRYGIATTVPVDAAYPYLVWEVARFVPRPGYRGFSVHLGNQHLGSVTNVEPGIYAFDALAAEPPVGASQGANAPAAALRRLEFALYNADVLLGSIAMVRRPANYIALESPAFAAKGRLEKGDTLTLRVHLAEPAEDVTLTLYDSYTMPQLTLNGQRKLQLKPEDEVQKIWSATLTVDAIEGHALKPGHQFTPNRLLVKATVLGGAIRVPLWTGNPHPFVFNAEPATTPD